MVVTSNYITVQNTQLSTANLHTPDRTHTLTEIHRLQHSTPLLPLTCPITRARIVPASTYAEWSVGTNSTIVLNWKISDYSCLSGMRKKLLSLDIFKSTSYPLRQIYKIMRPFFLFWFNLVDGGACLPFVFAV